MSKRKKSEVYGTLILDVDGTLTEPENDYKINNDVLEALAEFNCKGGDLIFCTGATLGRIERSVLEKLYSMLFVKAGEEKAKTNFKNIYILPENGSALLLNKKVSVVENELEFDWYKIHELHVPNKKELATAIQEELVPKYEGSSIVGDFTKGYSRREYILSLKGLKDALEVKEHLEGDFKKRYPEFDWDNIRLKAARTTIDFVHADSGKTYSVAWCLKELSGLKGPVIGFGDLGDEFAKVVPTINVNTKDPNSFRRRKMPSMELSGGWNLLKNVDYVITGRGSATKVREEKTDTEINILRNINGEIIFAKEAEEGKLQPTDNKEGHPVKIEPLEVQTDQDYVEIDGAGKGTAWMIRRLMNVDYFS